MGLAVGNAVGLAVGLAVGVSVGLTVGFAVGVSVGLPLWGPQPELALATPRARQESALPWAWRYRMSWLSHAGLLRCHALRLQRTSSRGRG